MSWQGEEPVSQRLGALAGSFPWQQHRLQLRMLFECHRIAAEDPEREMWQPAAAGIKKCKPKEPGFSSDDWAHGHDWMRLGDKREHLIGPRAPILHFSFVHL
ncbi:MAG TPA: hypothetical protein VF856_00715 [Gemmatimonadaceae bacterium]